MAEAHDVVTIGTAVRDIVMPLEGGVMRIGAGEKIVAGAPFISSGGGALNAAVTFAKLGFSPLAVFRTGDDEPAEAIMRDMERAGVSCAVHRAKGEATGQSVVIVYESGERTAIAHRGACEALTLRDIPFGDITAKWAYIAPSRIEPSVIHKAVERLYYQGVAIAFNPSAFYLENHGARLKPILAYIKILIMNREEASILTGIPRTYEQELFKKLDAMISGIAIMTDGPRGVLVSDGARMYKAGIFPNKEVVDRTGAGDAFGSAFVSGMMLKGDIPYAIRLASANATHAVESIGAQTGLLSLSTFERDKRWQKLEITVTEIE